MHRSVQRSLTLTSVVLLLAIGMGLWPRTTSAARATVMLADANKAWSGGLFFRTGLALDQPNGPGGIQLVPSKVQTQYTTAFPLPIPLSSHASATYRNRIFVVGGDTFYVDPNTSQATSDMVKSPRMFTARRAVNNATGELEDWESLADTSNLPQALADTTLVVATVNNQPFLVSLGGMRGRTSPASADDLTSVTTKRIYYYPISMDAQGTLTPQTWRTATQSLPFNPDYDLPAYAGTALRGSGASGVMAVSVTVAGQPYIYLFGGHSRIFNGQEFKDTYFSTVFRAPLSVDGSNNLVIGNWEWNTNDNDVVTLPFDNNKVVELAGAATSSYTDPITGDTGVYLVGGNNGALAGQQDANAYAGKINGSTGAITWMDKGNMSESRSAHAGVQSDGMITVSGGRDGTNTPTTSLALGSINPDLTLYRDPDNPQAANFELGSGALIDARANHTMETIKGVGNTDFAYVIGGAVTRSGTSINATPDVLFGNLDAPTLPTDNVVANGKYYSPIQDFGKDAQYFTLQWKAVFPQNDVDRSFGTNPIKLQYRVGDSQQSMGTPIDVPVTTVEGENTFTFAASTTGRYFQFIATLTGSTTKKSAILDWVKLDVNRNGFPNVSVVKNDNTPNIQPNSIPKPYGKTVVQPNVLITNQMFQAIPVLDADWDGNGGVYVDLYIYHDEPGKPKHAAPTLGETGTFYTVLPKSVLKVGSSVSINPGTWRKCVDVAGSQTCQEQTATQADWASKFNEEGTYSVYIMVDSIDAGSFTTHPFGMVVESDQPGTNGESDNVAGPITVAVTKADTRSFLPINYVKASANLAAQRVTATQPRPLPPVLNR